MPLANGLQGDFEKRTLPVKGSHHANAAIVTHVHVEQHLPGLQGHHRLRGRNQVIELRRNKRILEEKNERK
jgi:hypothetical protein